MNYKMARRAIKALAPTLGIVIILSSILFSPETNPQLHVTVLLVGVLILQAEAWGFTRVFLPSERVYVALREEVDRFLGLVRVLNQVAARDDGQKHGEVFRDTMQEMHISVECMAEFAGHPERRPVDGTPRLERVNRPDIPHSLS